MVSDPDRDLDVPAVPPPPATAPDAGTGPRPVPELPAPPPPGPAAPQPGSRRPDDHLRVSDAERDETAALLREHTAAGRLTLEDFSERVDLTMSARTRGDLRQIQRDLPAVGGGAPVERVRSSGWAVAIFGDDRREGRWDPGTRTGAVGLFGDATVDLRSAEVTGQVLDVEAYAVFGTVVVLVPEGVAVELSGMSVFGDRRAELEGERLPGLPVIRVRAVSLFGDVHIRSRPRRKLWDRLLGRPPEP